MKTIASLALSIMLLAVAFGGETEERKIPAEVQPFVEKNSKPIALEAADLNGDGTKDYVLVLEREKPKLDKDDLPKNQRPLLILLRGKDEKLMVAARNEKVVMCSQCGGVLGDPFQGVTVGTKTFAVSHYGGSNWRWSSKYKFEYEAGDAVWQLARVEKSSFHTGNPDDVNQEVLTPKDFGKVDLADFDPAKLDQPDAEQTSSSDMDNDQSAHTSTNQDVVTLSSLPSSFVQRFLKSDLSRAYDVGFRAVNPFYLTGDFDGDGQMDYVLRLVSKTNKDKEEDAVFFAKGEPRLLSEDIKEGYPGPAWYVVSKSERLSPGISEKPDAKPPQPKGDSIMMVRPESSAALIYWTGKRFEISWQSD